MRRGEVGLAGTIRLRIALQARRSVNNQAPDEEARISRFLLIG